MSALIFVHSPLVGPMTWSLVAERLRSRGIAAIAPPLPGVQQDGAPFWSRHARAVADAMVSLAADNPPFLVGHSGAGVLLPAIRKAADVAVAGYIFIDADIPRDSASRLGLFGSPQEADEFRGAASDGNLPVWVDSDLRHSIPDDALRERFVAELRPLPLAVYEEPLPVFEGWPDAPCGYLQFSPPYEGAAGQARDNDWPLARLEGSHFHMLNDPAAVADALLDLARRLGHEH